MNNCLTWLCDQRYYSVSLIKNCENGLCDGVNLTSMSGTTDWEEVIGLCVTRGGFTMRQMRQAPRAQCQFFYCVKKL